MPDNSCSPASAIEHSAYCNELSLPDLKKALSAADKGRERVYRDALIHGSMQEKMPPSHLQVVARNRKIITCNDA